MSISSQRIWIHKGETLLRDAEKEINRSSEDVVTYGVCHNTRNAVSAYLNAFLVANGQEAEDSSPEVLLEKCALMDARFSEVDLSIILCKLETTEQNDCFCMDPEKVAQCLNLAQQIGKMVKTDPPGF